MLIKHRMPHADANEAFFFNRSLEFVRATAYRQQYPELQGRLLVPVDNSIPNWAELATESIYDKRGRAEISSSYATNSPRADVVAKQLSYGIKAIRGSYGYTIQDLRAAMGTGQDLPGQRALAAREMIETAIDEMIFIGSKIAGVTGLTNATGTHTHSCSVVWASATVAQILADLQTMVDKVSADTGEVEFVDTMAIAPSLWRVINGLLVPDTLGKTVVEWFQLRNPRVTMVVANKLETTNPSAKPQIITYRRNPDKLAALIPQEFEQFPAQERGLESIIECHARCGGVSLKFPKSMLYATGMT